MAKVTGTVYKWFSKEWPAKRPGGKPNMTWSLKLENDPMYYRAQRLKDGSAPKTEGVEPGDTVSFEASEVNDNSAQIIGTVDKVVATQATVATVGQSNTAIGGAGAVNSGGSREASIHYQSARKDALLLVQVALANGCVKMPAKEAAKLEALEALVDHYTAAYFADIATFGAVARANGTEETADPVATVGDDAE